MSKFNEEKCYFLPQFFLKEIGIRELHKKAFKVQKREMEFVSPMNKTKSLTKNSSKIDNYQIKLSLPDDATESKRLKIGKLVKSKMKFLIENNLLSDQEIIRLQRADYSRETFHIQYPLLKKTLPSDANNIPRYWAGKVKIKESYYFICSEWYEQQTNNDRPYFETWYREISNSL